MRVPEIPARSWQLRLEVDEPEARVAVATDADGTIIGLATAGAARDADARTAWELYSIHVVAEQQGSGLADDLIRVTTRDSDTTVWVQAGNARARRFYRRHGFGVDGGTQVHEDTGASEIRMVRRFRSADR